MVLHVRRLGLPPPGQGWSGLGAVGLGRWFAERQAQLAGCGLAPTGQRHALPTDSTAFKSLSSRANAAW
jgi:hypothetical protein